MQIFKAPNGIPGPDSVVFAILDFDCQKRGLSTRSLSGLAKKTGWTVRKIRSSLNRLEQSGYITKARRFNQSSVYKTEPTGGTYTPIVLSDLPLEECWLFARLRFAQNQNGCSWPSLKTLSDWSGWSENTVIKYLARLESRGALQVKRQGGGHHRGNRYICKNLRSRCETRPQKPHTIHKNLKDLKTPKRISHKILLSSQVRTALISVGMRPSTADRILFDTPAEFVRDLLENAYARRFWLSTRDPLRAERFNLAGYVIRAVQRMRFEGGTAKLSAASEALRRLRRPAKLLTPGERDKRREAMIRAVRAG